MKREIDTPVDISDELCILVGFNPYRGSERMSIPADMVRRADQRFLVDSMIEFADSHGPKMRHEYREVCLQAVGRLLMQAGVKALPEVKSKIIRACELDSRAARNRSHRESVARLRQQIIETI